MAEINTEKKEKEYKDEYVIINLETEYHGYNGDIPYAIVTDLWRTLFKVEKIEDNFEETIKRYGVYLFCIDDLPL